MTREAFRGIQNRLVRSILMSEIHRYDRGLRDGYEDRSNRKLTEADGVSLLKFAVATMSFRVVCA